MLVYQAASLLAALESAAQVFEQAAAGKAKAKAQKALVRLQKMAVPQFLCTTEAENNGKAGRPCDPAGDGYILPALPLQQVELHVLRMWGFI